MSILIEVVAGLGITAVCGFMGWMAISVVRINVRLAELEQRIISRELECSERLAWLRNIEGKVDIVGKDTAAICGHLNIDRSQ